MHTTTAMPPPLPLYSRAMGFFFTPGGPVIGRQAIQKWYTDLWQSWHSTNYTSKADGNAYHLIGTAGNEAWATGESNQIGQGPNGEPMPVKNHWLTIFVREGDDWKNFMCAFGNTPATDILANKVFAPQPAATPSPTASPSTQ
jgi:ketosteroid isomerase-like protein